MRISTAEIFGNGISAMHRQQHALNHTQLQLSTGKRILTPSDDPGGAVQSLKFRERIAAVDQYARNANGATARLEQQETVLNQMSTALQRVRELTVRASNATETDESRAALAREVEEIAGALLDAANARDASGDYLFAGNRTANRPFVRNASGEVEYLGDEGQRRVALSPERGVAVGDPGSVLMRIDSGNRVFSVAPDAGNAGTGRVNTAEVVDAAQVTGGAFRLEITVDGTWEIRDPAADPTDPPLADGPFEPGQAIDFQGKRVVLNGSPEPGDAFDIGPAQPRSVFGIVDELAAALAQPRPTDADRAQQQHATATALGDLDHALERLGSLRSQTGARLNTIESQGIVNDDQKLQLQSALSAVEDLDYAEAISRFSRQQVTLQAAQQTFAQLGRMSLFDYLR